MRLGPVDTTFFLLRGRENRHQSSSLRFSFQGTVVGLSCIINDDTLSSCSKLGDFSFLCSMMIHRHPPRRGRPEYRNCNGIEIIFPLSQQFLCAVKTIINQNLIKSLTSGVIRTTNNNSSLEPPRVLMTVWNRHTTANNVKTSCISLKSKALKRIRTIKLKYIKNKILKTFHTPSIRVRAYDSHKFSESSMMKKM